MELIACTCNWSIPGVNRLPPHSHTIGHVHIRKRCGDGKVIRVHPSTLVDPNVWCVVDREPDSINIWIDWKAIARTLAPLTGEDEYDMLVQDGQVIARWRRIT